MRSTTGNTVRFTFNITSKYSMDKGEIALNLYKYFINTHNNNKVHLT